MLDPRTRPRVVNVVSTSDLVQRVSAKKMAAMPCCMYDEAVYGGRCGYIKTPGMQGRVTVFISGKMISVGARSVRASFGQLHEARLHLVRNGAAGDCKIRPVVRNIVATVDAGRNVPIDRISSRMPGAVYDPGSFPGMILKGLDSCSFLVFASGKMVIAGAKSPDELRRSSFDLLTRLNNAGA
ncbi:TATA-box binding protein (TBP), component of TFIID and TFIIIB [Cenarchaeum symbiosum A]|uniref:TATA-box-binding protein n=1 Tax=Cenarchaeum symbiosum (strain A) TaxID=414004 RepID=TBP_CENSY|nr:RecName: Full=TATA-box-binding protein; AltName: Full=Box A-binding protein; Short=BAP; AltName: Full=TATA sequence-binding protein; Short=TBP; AltName: Full=TATA-box factor [Cenarchaeum symbiosum A]AAC62688.1 TATA box binding protein [Cenarchaeum symbiosum]ABK77802.1 TATA-box binding protein (TBP), component of TFIID and TFIIIB [Cenarchaeum symbiosum A]